MGERPETADPSGESAETEDSASAENLSRALAAIAAQMREIRSQLDRLLTIQIDRMKLKLRTGIFWAVAGVLLLAVGLTAAALGVAYLIAGLSGAFGELLGGRAWAGDLVAGTLVLLAILLIVSIARRGGRRGELKKLMQKYESREQGR